MRPSVPPRQNPATNFPPPPRRTAPKTTARPPPPKPAAAGPQTRSTYVPPPSAGAQRYASYANAGTKTWDRVHEEAQARAEAFRGFQNMKPQTNQSSGWRTFDAKTGKTHTHYQANTANAAGSNSRPAPSWEQHTNATPKTHANAHPSTFSARKKHGFAPGDAGGDEPMAQNTSAYFNVSRGERPQASRPQSSYFDAVPSPTAKQTAPASPLRHTKSSSGMASPGGVSRPGVQRQSTKYATSGGEKTFVDSSNFRKASSVRTSPIDPRLHTNDIPHFEPPKDESDRNRSRSPKMRASERFSSTSSEGSDSSEDLFYPNRRKAVPRRPAAKKGGTTAGTAKTKQHQGTDDSYVYPPPPSRSAAANASEAQFGRDTSGTDNKYGPSLSSSFSYTYPKEWRNKWKSYLEQEQNKKTWWAYPTNVIPRARCTDPEKAESKRAKALEKTKTRKKPTRDLVSNSFMNTFPSSGSNANSNAASSSSGTTSTTDSGRPSQSDLPQFKSYSSENVQTKFSPAEWDGKFTADNPFFAPTAAASSSKSTRGRSTPARGPTPSATDSSVPSPTFPAPNQSRPAPAPFPAAKFNADQWKEAFEFAPKGTDTVRGSQTMRAKSPKKVSRGTTKRTTVPRGASVTSETAADRDVPLASTETNDPSPKDTPMEDMDIDETPVGYANSAGQDSKTTQPQPRTVNVEVNRPSASNLDKESAPKSQNKSTLNLDSLRNSAPFTASNKNGLGDLNDLTTTLPFPSQPANGINIFATQSSAPPVKLPTPPQVPLSPFPNCTRNSWERYTAEMAAYMYEWNKFSQRMLKYFADRQETYETGLNARWISCAGDGGSLESDDGDEVGLVKYGAKGGYAAYLKMLNEDVRARVHWDVANERHLACIKGLGDTRAKVKELVVRGLLK